MYKQNVSWREMIQMDPFRMNQLVKREVVSCIISFFSTLGQLRCFLSQLAQRGLFHLISTIKFVNLINFCKKFRSQAWFLQCFFSHQKSCNNCVTDVIRERNQYKNEISAEAKEAINERKVTMQAGDFWERCMPANDGYKRAKNMK